MLGSPNTTTYIYDAVGDLEKIYGTSATTATRVKRLTPETLYDASDAVAGTITHAYDAVGNRIARTVANFSPAVNGLGNQTLAYDQRDLIDGDANPANANPWYDLNGNSLADETGAGTGDIYDAENRLIQRGSGMFFSYDENGNRVKKVTPAGTTYYLVDDRNPTGYAQALAEYSSVNTSVAPTVTYTIGAELISQSRSGTVRYYGYDGQGSVRFLTDATISTAGGPATQITDTYDYEAYGMLLAGSGSTPNNYRYTGQQWDADLGMYYLRARYYKPGIGRFWTMDSYSGNNDDPLSLHKYVYCQGNPINGTDPSGSEMSWSSYMGYAAEEAIQDEYRATHGGDIVEYGSQQPFGKSVLNPDIFNISKKKFLEIKTISYREIKRGLTKLSVDTAAFGPLTLKYRPEASWQPRSHILETTDGEPIFVINVGGLVLYKELDQIKWELITVASIKGANDLLPYLTRLTVAELRPVVIRMAARVGIALTAELGEYLGVATTNSTMGAP